jgi:hypothetical protein
MRPLIPRFIDLLLLVNVCVLLPGLLAFLKIFKVLGIGVRR